MAKRVTYTILAKDAFSKAGTKIAGVAKKMTSQFGKLASTINPLSGQFSSLVTAAAGFFGAKQFFSAGMKFQDAMADLSAITGSTGKDFNFLRDESLRLAKASKVSAAETAGAFTLVASAKAELLKSPKALSKVTEQVLTLANASGLDLATSAQVVTEALNQYGLAADQAGRFVNVLAAGSKFGASIVADTGTAIVNSAGAAKLAKVGFEELNGTIQILAKQGIKAEVAGTALKELFKKLESQSNKKLRPSVVGLNTVLENLAKKNLTVMQAMRLFGDTAFDAGLKLIENRKQLKQMTADVTGTTIATQQATIRTGTFSAKLRGLGIVVEESLIKTFNRLEQDKLFSNMADDFARWANTITATDIERVASALFLMAKGAAELAIQLGDAAKRFGEIVNFWQQLFGGGGTTPKGMDLGLNAAVKDILGIKQQSDILLKISAPPGVVDEVKTQAQAPNLNVGVNMQVAPG